MWGKVEPEQRKKLLSTSSCLFQPMIYTEPCGQNVIEAMLSGTPVIAMNYGGFINAIKEGVTGYLYGKQEIINNVTLSLFDTKEIVEIMQ